MGKDSQGVRHLVKEAERQNSHCTQDTQNVLPEYLIKTFISEETSHV